MTNEELYAAIRKDLEKIWRHVQTLEALHGSTEIYDLDGREVGSYFSG